MGNPRYANGHRRRELRKRLLATQDTCALCGQPIDKTLHYLDPGAPVVDEDVPIVHGGSPLSRANTNLMHRACNAWKGTRTLEVARSAWFGETPPAAALTTSRAW